MPRRVASRLVVGTDQPNHEGGNSGTSRGRELWNATPRHVTSRLVVGAEEVGDESAVLAVGTPPLVYLYGVNRCTH